MSDSLSGCVSSLRTTMQLLDFSISTLDSGVNDFPRLAKVLQTTRHFELISEPELQNAQAALLSEIKPEVESLLNRVSTYLDKLERREQSLIAKCDLQEGRLSQGEGLSARKSHSRNSSNARTKTSGAGTTSLEELKVKQLRQKKDRLSYAVDRLTLQAQQRERQLRMSMAGQ